MMGLSFVIWLTVLVKYSVKNTCRWTFMGINGNFCFQFNTFNCFLTLPLNFLSIEILLFDYLVYFSICIYYLIWQMNKHYMIKRWKWDFDWSHTAFDVDSFATYFSKLTSFKSLVCSMKYTGLFHPRFGCPNIAFYLSISTESCWVPYKELVSTGLIIQG